MRPAPKLAAALLGAALSLGGGLGRALACAICLSAVSVTTGQKLDAADQVALATPVSDGERFKIAEAVKGDAPLGTVVEATSDHAKDFPAGAGKLSLLARNGMSGRWTNFGAIGAENAAWLRELLKTNDGRAMTPPRPLASPEQTVGGSTDWSKRITLIEPYLESDDPLVAEIAFGELSRTPYDIVRTLRSTLKPDKIRRWVLDPALSRRHAPYILLLGVTGGADDATALEERLAGARASHDATDVAAMLAADLELRGPSRVAWIEENYLADRGRALPEIEAALLGLEVHGDAGGVIPRQRVVDAYRRFIRARKPMAGFVATYLNDWKAWDAVSDYVEVLRSNAVKDPGDQFAIVTYLRDCPNAEAHSAAEAFIAQAN